MRRKPHAGGEIVLGQTDLVEDSCNGLEDVATAIDQGAAELIRYRVGMLVDRERLRLIRRDSYRLAEHLALLKVEVLRKLGFYDKRDGTLARGQLSFTHDELASLTFSAILEELE